MTDLRDDPDPSVRPVGYARVSSEEQNYDLQVAALKEAGVREELIFVDVESGRGEAMKREGLRLALMACREGGFLLVWRLDRLGRNLEELIKTVNRLEERGINFRSLTQGEINTDNRKTATGRLIFNIFASLAQYESDQIGERTRAGQKIAREKGVRFGRVPFEEKYPAAVIDEYRRLRCEGDNIKTALEKVNIPYPTYQKHRKQIEAPAVVDDIGGPEVEE